MEFSATVRTRGRLVLEPRAASSRRWRRWLAVAWFGSALVRHAFAAPVAIGSTPTTLESTADRMISYRHQNHSWQTSDGATHVKINRGTQPTGNSLQLFSTYDGGATWIGSVALARSGVTSTSDGHLINDTLYVTHSTPSGQIMFSALRYAATSNTWRLVKSETAFSAPDVVGLNPAMAVDALGTIWLAFVGNEIATGNYFIKLLSRTDAEGWTDTGLVFGGVDNASIERSARPVATPRGMGMVYTVHENIYWAARDNGAPATQPWATQLLFSSTAGDTDPYASHFSVATDAQRNIHVAAVDGGRVLYLRFASRLQKWTSKWLTADTNSGYVQVTAAQGNIVVAANSGSQVAVHQSADGGVTFVRTHVLVHPAATPGVSYDYPRIETPLTSLSPVPLLQQYEDNGIQRLLYFAVPVGP